MCWNMAKLGPFNSSAMWWWVGQILSRQTQPQTLGETPSTSRRWYLAQAVTEDATSFRKHSPQSVQAGVRRHKG